MRKRRKKKASTAARPTRRDAPRRHGAKRRGTDIAALRRELADAHARETATADVLKIISRSTFDLQAVLDTLVKSAVRLCGAESAHIFRRAEGVYELAACRGYSREYEKHIRRRRIAPGRDSLVGRIALEGRMVHIPDVLADHEYHQSESPRLGGWRTMLGVPLLREGVPIGALTLTRSSVQPFTDKQIELLTTFADQAVIAIENARLFDAEQAHTRELAEALEQQTATSNLLQVISSSPGELGPVFESLLKNAVQLCQAKFGDLYLRDGDAVRMVASHGAPTAYVQARTRAALLQPPPDAPLGRVAATNQVVHIADIKTIRSYVDGDPFVVAGVELARYRTVLAVPMLKDGVLIGAVTICRQEVLPFAKKQIELVANFARQAVIAIENVRLLNELRESLRQQTATADVLKVISSSPGELDLVFQAMLEKAVRICEANFGTLQLRENDAFRVSAMHNPPPAFAEARRRNPLLYPNSKNA